MGLYEFVSGILTIAGSVVLIYRIIHELESGRAKKVQLQKLCTKWLIFTIFIKIEFYLLVVFDFIPLGKMLLLVFKLFLFLPKNSISHSIFKKIHRQLERIKLESYRSHFTIATSFLCTISVALLLKLTAKIAAYIDSDHIEEVERHILEIIKTLQYKKTAINMRQQAHVSDVNKELNSSEFSNSIIEEELRFSRKRKTGIANRMNRLLVTDESDQYIRVKAELMVVKPNKETATKAKYKHVEVEYHCPTSILTFLFGTSSEKKESYTLTEVRWITKDMMNIEAVVKEGESKIIRIRDIADVVRWMEPVCANLQRLEQG